MTTILADGRDDSGGSYGTTPQASRVSRQTPDGPHHRRHKRRRPRLTLLDFPVTGGMPREIAGHYPRLQVRRKALLAITASAALAVSGVFGAQAFLRSSGTTRAPDIRVPLVPFPTAAASSPPPPLAINLQGTQLSPSQAPLQAAKASASPADRVTPLATASATASPQTIKVNYFVVSSMNGAFEGEVQVVNDGSTPIEDWQITVALPHDEITSFYNASGYVSNHILLLQPEPDAGPLAAGSELRVFFVAEGQEETPELCAFNNIICG